MERAQFLYFKDNLNDGFDDQWQVTQPGAPKEVLVNFDGEFAAAPTAPMGRIAAERAVPELFTGPGPDRNAWGMSTAFRVDDAAKNHEALGLRAGVRLALSRSTIFAGRYGVGPRQGCPR